MQNVWYLILSSCLVLIAFLFRILLAKKYKLIKRFALIVIARLCVFFKCVCLFKETFPSRVLHSLFSLTRRSTLCILNSNSNSNSILQQLFQL